MRADEDARAEPGPAEHRNPVFKLDAVAHLNVGVDVDALPEDALPPDPRPGPDLSLVPDGGPRAHISLWRHFRRRVDSNPGAPHRTQPTSGLAPFRRYLRCLVVTGQAGHLSHLEMAHDWIA